jgi:RNA recognition motif-containing protein
VAVTQVFREYGPVFIKIRRDSKHMPFAFAQYTHFEHAQRAIQHGKGRLIKGRPCRCEKAKAHRKLIRPLLTMLVSVLIYLRNRC